MCYNEKCKKQISVNQVLFLAIIQFVFLFLFLAQNSLTVIVGDFCVYKITLSLTTHYLCGKLIIETAYLPYFIKLEEKTMDKKIVFVVAKKENGKLCYAENNLQAEDALTLLALVTSYVYKVGTEKIGLTDDEIMVNITNAIEVGIETAEPKEEQES